MKARVVKWHNADFYAVVCANGMVIHLQNMDDELTDKQRYDILENLLKADGVLNTPEKWEVRKEMEIPLPVEALAKQDQRKGLVLATGQVIGDFKDGKDRF